MRFSIIIPVYNVEKYIRRCMDSLVNQTFRDYELIIIDDESPDNSIEIAKSYASADPDRIRIFHQKNTRQGGARNHGVSLARGEYLLFVDSDDYVSPYLLEVVDRRLRETPCDILVFGSTPVDEGGNALEDEICESLAPGMYFPKKRPDVVSIPGAPWGKAFRTEFYVGTGFQFPEKLLYEDVATRLLYAQARNIFVAEDRLYYYVHRANSSMTQKLSEKMLDILKVSDLVLEEFKRKRLYDSFRSQLDVSLIYSLMYIEEIINLREPGNSMQIPIADYLGTHFPDYRENPCASPELKRVLDCLLKHRFYKYHYRFLLLNRGKDRLMQNRAINWLIQLRKKHGSTPASDKS